MKTVVINAGPRRRDTNAQIIKSAAEGAEAAGSDVKYVDLYKLQLSGCRACNICKRPDNACRCYWKDEVSPLIEEILNADCLLIAAPVFFSEPTSHYRALMERIIYCIVSFEVGNAFKGKVNVGLFYTLEYSKEYFEKSVRPNLKMSEDLLKMLNGKLEVSTVQYTTKRELEKKDEDYVKKAVEELSRDLENAYNIGFELSKI